MHICIICIPAKAGLRTLPYYIVFLYFYKNPLRAAYADPHTVLCLAHGMEKYCNLFILYIFYSFPVKRNRPFVKSRPASAPRRRCRTALRPFFLFDKKRTCLFPKGTGCWAHGRLFRQDCTLLPRAGHALSGGTLRRQHLTRRFFHGKIMYISLKLHGLSMLFPCRTREKNLWRARGWG